MNKPVPQWANTEPDAGAPHALLERLAQRIPVAAIEEIWLFPTRRIATGESTVFVVAADDDDDAERRRVITARYTVSRSNKGVATVQEHVEEHGIAPMAALARIAQGVLRRMGEEGEQPPRAERIEHSQERWYTLVEELGGTRPAPAEPAAAEPSGQEDDTTADEASAAPAAAPDAAPGALPPRSSD